MKKIGILDTSILSFNLGDQIIMESTRKELHNVIKDSFVVNLPKQMLKCTSCHKRFVCDHGQLTYYSHQPQSKWNDLIIETQKGNSLLHTAAKINVHESTVFRMRHKYLHFIEDMESPIHGRS